MQVIECKTEEEFKDIFLALLTNHPYPKLISSLRKDGSAIPLNQLNWDLTIAEEQGFEAILVTKGYISSHFIGFAKNTLITGYFPVNETAC